MRLYGIDAPEVRGNEREEGLKSRDFLRGLLLGQHVVIQTYKDKKGKYGRWLCKVWFDGVDVNDLLVKKGYAEWKDY